MREFSDSIAGSAAAIWCLRNYLVKSFHDLLQVGLAGKANIVISPVLNRENMPISGSINDQINTFGLVLRYFVRANTLNKKPTKHVSSIIRL